MLELLFAALETVLMEQDFEGRPAELLDRIRLVRGGHLFDRYFPTNSSTAVDEASSPAISTSEGWHHRGVSGADARWTPYPSTHDRRCKRGCKGGQSQGQRSLEVLMTIAMDQRDGVTAVTATRYPSVLEKKKRRRGPARGPRAAGAVGVRRHAVTAVTSVARS